MTDDAQAPAPCPPLLLRPRDAARVLAMSERTLWEKTKTKEIRCLKFGEGKRAMVRYELRELAAWVDAQRQQQAGEIISPEISDPC
jgi:hypothetical protein